MLLLKISKLFRDLPIAVELCNSYTSRWNSHRKTMKLNNSTLPAAGYLVA
jgi:hypothetical protein